MRFSLVLKSILLIVVFPVPHTVPGLWWALVNMVFYFGRNIFLRKIPIETFVFMHMVFTCLQQLVYTLSFNVTFVFTFFFGINFHLEVDYTLPFLITLHKYTQTTHKLY